jgi:hypothetical protein
VPWETATELVGASCGLTGDCPGTAVCGIWYDVWSSGLVGPFPVCEWHVHDMLTRPERYEVMRHASFVRLRDSEPWLPPKGMTEHTFYEVYPGPRYHPAIALADLGSWSPPIPGVDAGSTRRHGGASELGPADERHTHRLESAWSSATSPDASWVPRIIVIMFAAGLFVKAVSAVRTGAP